ncbi:hypothetical protein CP965_10395 [Halarcobacter mediterraneus]|uniref:SH3b domain-containing protein n=1 Tax=Halarcobacter mediterraneus TaxID=2023153 RepID=A0A4Q1B2M5_9BACT|nr:hypothetical protein [Halarcobacter mediterraneus]RXK12179.1 hypothetical protein CP965_10395 [Halarcobacter mediterraneus]
MKKYLIIFILFISILSANTQTQTQKPSELELFLFKIGFEALLNDVDETKQKTDLNEEDIKELKQKVTLLMDEVYKEKTSLENKNNNEDIDKLKEEIKLLKKELIQFKNRNNIEIKEKKVFVPKKNSIKYKNYIVATNIANIYTLPNANSQKIDKVKRNTVLKIERCDRFGWCKFYQEEKYIQQFLLK